MYTRVEGSGVFVLGLPIVVIGVSFDEAFKEVDQWKIEKALAKAEKRWASAALRATLTLSHLTPVARALPV